MNTNLASSLLGLLLNLCRFSLNFIDDLLCLFLSHWGIHWTWLQFCGYGLIAGKLIYWLLKSNRFFIDKYQSII
jgi:hypothetical protein